MSRQRGTALVTALLVVALASIAATAMLKQQHIDIRRADNMINGNQAALYVLAGEGWARSVLLQDRAQSEADSLAESWAKIGEPIAIEDGKISVRISDLQGRYNLNNLLDNEGKPSKPDIQRLRNLLVVLELDAELVQPILDWIDPDINPGLPGGAEDQAYLALEVPYRTANAPFVSTSELRLVQGITAEAYDKLAPYVAALPERVPVNVNTAPAAVLAAAIDGMTLPEAQQLVEQRPEQGYKDEAEFRGQQALEGREIRDISVGSKYFMVQVNVRLGRYNANQQSILAREEGKQLPSVIQRSRAEL